MAQSYKKTKWNLNNNNLAFCIFFVSSSRNNARTVKQGLGNPVLHIIVSSCSNSITTIVSTILASDEILSIKYLTYTNYGHRATYCSRAGLPNLFTSTGHIYGRKVIAGQMQFYQDSTPQRIASLLYKNRCSLWPVFWVSVPKSK